MSDAELGTRGVCFGGAHGFDATAEMGAFRTRAPRPPHDRSYAEVGRWRWSRRLSAAVVGSEVGLLGEDQGVVHLNPEISDGALQLRVAE